MYRTVKPNSHHLGDAARIVAVRPVDLRLQHRLHEPRSPQTTGKYASARALNSHCDSGATSNLIRLKR